MPETSKIIREEIDAVCNVYRTAGDAMFDEVRERLSLRIAERLANLPENSKLRQDIEAIKKDLEWCRDKNGGNVSLHSLITQINFALSSN
jgi:hypothetical protein